jgi:hypothetical protein
MSSELEKALEKAKYSALPLPRAKSEPTTVFAFTEGHLFIVRNAHSCLPNPPLAVTQDGSADTLTFSREFSFQLTGVVSFILKIFGAGNANAELEANDVKSATVVLGGLSHHTIATGDLIDYLLKQDAKSPCMRDLTNKSNFLIVAALQANSFTYTFKNQKGVTVKFSAPAINSMFKVDASVNVNITNEGSVVVNAPSYIGVVTWDGKKIAQEIDKAKKFASGKALRGYKAPSVFEIANEPSEVAASRLASLGASRKKR